MRAGLTCPFSSVSDSISFMQDSTLTLGSHMGEVSCSKATLAIAVYIVEGFYFHARFFPLGSGVLTFVNACEPWLLQAEIL